MQRLLWALACPYSVACCTATAAWLAACVTACFCCIEYRQMCLVWFAKPLIQPLGSILAVDEYMASIKLQ
jgi:hypothetical protein